MYTLDNVKEAKSYVALNRKGFTDAQVVEYYNMETVAERTNFFKSMTTTAPIVAKPSVRAILSNSLNINRGTHLCTSFFQEVEKMAIIKMNTTFKYLDISFNAIEENYRLVFTNSKGSFGRHCVRRGVKTIELSKWMIENSKEDDMNLWIDTILHEIAHAIDYRIRGRSNHQWQWQNIARSVGCVAKSTAHNEETVGNAKYTITCINCGRQKNGHKYSRVLARGGRSCGKCGNGYFDRDKLLIQRQNY